MKHLREISTIIDLLTLVYFKPVYKQAVIIWSVLYTHPWVTIETITYKNKLVSMNL